jgi:hypothetical protein
MVSPAGQPSVRTLHLKLDETLKDDSDQNDEVARISGTQTDLSTVALPKADLFAAALAKANTPQCALDGWHCDDANAKLFRLSGGCEITGQG